MPLGAPQTLDDLRVALMNERLIQFDYPILLDRILRVSPAVNSLTGVRLAEERKRRAVEKVSAGAHGGAQMIIALRRLPTAKPKTVKTALNRPLHYARRWRPKHRFHASPSTKWRIAQ